MNFISCSIAWPLGTRMLTCNPATVNVWSSLAGLNLSKYGFPTSNVSVSGTKTYGFSVIAISTTWAFAALDGVLVAAGCVGALVAATEVEVAAGLPVGCPVAIVTVTEVTMGLAGTAVRTAVAEGAGVAVGAETVEVPEGAFMATAVGVGIAVLVGATVGKVVDAAGLESPQALAATTPPTSTTPTMARLHAFNISISVPLLSPGYQ